MPISILGQSGSADQMGELLSALGWLVGAALIAAVAGVIIYKRFSPKQEHQAGSATFSLADLRRLRDEGQITEEEFQKARGRVIGENRDMADEGTEV